MDEQQKEKKRHITKDAERARQRSREYYIRNRDSKHEYYEQNKDHILEANKRRYLEQQNERKRYAKEYRETNKCQVREANARWRDQNRDYIKEEKKRYYAANKSRILKQYACNYQKKREQRCVDAKQWRSDNRDLVAQYNRNRKALVKQSEGRHTAEDIRRIWKKQKHRCNVPGCTNPISDNSSSPFKYHVDHVKAIVNGGRNDAHNLQILCPVHNLQKKQKDEYIWAQTHLGLLFPK